jgi:predicted regulator of Ras-like GTPase activity (Roadblock/LC7/MglB family)
MFGSLKKWFSKPATSPVTESQTQIPAQEPRNSPSPTAPVPLQTGDMIQLPLNDILERLPPAVAPLLLARPGGTFSLSVRSAMEQLGTGAVKIRFAELRRSALPGSFKTDATQDNTWIELPLPQILSALGPAAFSRRANQKVADVPEEVLGVFDLRGHITASPSLAAPPAPPVAAAPTPVAQKVSISAPIASPVAASAPPVAPRVSTPAPMAPSVVATPPPPVSLPKPSPAAKPISPIQPTTPKAPTAAPLPFVTVKPAAPQPLATQSPAPAFAAAPSFAPDAAEPSLGDGTLATTIGPLSALWPETIRQEIQQANLNGAPVSIPISRVEAGIKKGRVAIAWSEILGWIGAGSPIETSHGAIEVELPLHVVAPLFMAKLRAPSPQKKVNIGESIPDLFGGGSLVSVSIASPPSAPAAIVHAPDPYEVAPSMPMPVASERDALGELFGEPLKRVWTPQEITERIAAIHGVSGNVLATADGLLVAGQVAPPLKAETLAAFLPQMFGRMNGYAAEVKLGPLRAVTLNAESAPCAMFKAGKLHLAVVGIPGQSLPEAMLTRIAEELEKRNQ